MIHDVGQIELTASQTLKISISEWKGELAVDIRKYVETSSYTGPTAQGVRIGLRQFRQILNNLRENTSSANEKRVGVLGWTGKNFELDFVAQIIEYEGRLRLDLREQFTKNGVKLFSRKGIAVPLDKYNDFISLLEEALWLLENNCSDPKNN
jgi:hypothetical protein